jgi:hypothetical protein
MKDCTLIGETLNSVTEEGIRAWFRSKSKDNVPGWVDVVTGDSCASDKPGEGITKCVSSSKRDIMTPAERRSAKARKRAADPGQQEKSNAAKPTYVPTDSPTKKMKEEFFKENHKEIADGREKDEEGYMASTEMDTIDSAIKKLRKNIKKGDTQLPAWVQSKITKAADTLILQQTIWTVMRCLKSLIKRLKVVEQKTLVTPKSNLVIVFGLLHMHLEHL